MPETWVRLGPHGLELARDIQRWLLAQKRRWLLAQKRRRLRAQRRRRGLVATRMHRAPLRPRIVPPPLLSEEQLAKMAEIELRIFGPDPEP